MCVCNIIILLHTYILFMWIVYKSNTLTEYVAYTFSLPTSASSYVCMQRIPSFDSTNFRWFEHDERWKQFCRVCPTTYLYIHVYHFCKLSGSTAFRGQHRGTDANDWLSEIAIRSDTVTRYTIQINLLAALWEVRLTYTEYNTRIIKQRPLGLP